LGQAIAVAGQVLTAAAEQGAVADAAVRPQDQADFESWLLLDRHLDLLARRG
jgi:hypothetical protein